MDLPLRNSPNVRDLQAEIEDLKARLRTAEDESRELRRQQSTFVRFMELPPELRMLIWESALPDRRVLRISSVPVRAVIPYGMDMSFFCSARPPELLHVCKESRSVALRHFKPFFEKGYGSKTPRPIYFRPKLDILYIDLRSPGGIPLEYPEVNEVESIAIPTQSSANFWIAGEPSKFCFQGMTRLLLVTALEPPWPSNRCCATVELSPDIASKERELEWTGYIARKRLYRSVRSAPNIQHVEAVIGKSVHKNCYFT